MIHIKFKYNTDRNLLVINNHVFKIRLSDKNCRECMFNRYAGIEGCALTYVKSVDYYGLKRDTVLEVGASCYKLLLDPTIKSNRGNKDSKLLFEYVIVEEIGNNSSLFMNSYINNTNFNILYVNYG